MGFNKILSKYFMMILIAFLLISEANSSFVPITPNELFVETQHTGVWTELTPTTLPSGRNGHGMVYNSRHNISILFGGTNGVAKDDTWIYNYTTNTWTEMLPSTSPPAMAGMGIVYSYLHDKVIIFSGLGNSATRFNETWTYDFLTNTWTDMNPTVAPSFRSDAAIAYDITNDKVILYAGYNQPVESDTWAYDYLTNTWTRMNPANSPTEGRLEGHDLIYHPVEKVTYLLGGFNGFNAVSTGWQYNYSDNTWTDAAIPGGGGVRGTYDTTRDEIMVFFGDAFFSLNLTSKLWVLANSSSFPTNRIMGHSIVHNPVDDVFVIFGGYNANDGSNPSYRDDMWEYTITGQRIVTFTITSTSTTTTSSTSSTSSSSTTSSAASSTTSTTTSSSSTTSSSNEDDSPFYIGIYSTLGLIVSVYLLKKKSNKY